MTAAQNPLTPSPVSLAPGSSNLEVPERALAIGAHPDDVEFGCGSTLARWSDAGCEVSVLVCTDGSKGTWDPNLDSATLVARRQDEQAEAIRRLGLTGELVFGPWVDGELESSLTNRAFIAEWIRRLRPNVVLGHDPWKPYRLHPDHRHAGLLACEGVVAARDHLFFADQGIPHHRPDLMLLFETDGADHFEDVTGWSDHKIAALAAHESQFESTMLATTSEKIQADEMAVFADKVRGKLAAAGKVSGVEHAELFKLIDDL